MARSAVKRRAVLAVGVATTLAGLALAALDGTGLGTRDAGAARRGAAREASLSPALYLSTGALGAATGNGALGFRMPYYEPPSLAEPASPGFTINSAADQPDLFMVQEGS